MPIRSGKDYIRSLKDGRNLWIRGERIEDPTTHPALQPCIQTVADYYDLFKDPKYSDLLTFDPPEGGDRESLAFLRPKNAADLHRKRLMTEAVLRQSGGLLTRLPENIPTLLLGLLDVSAAFAKADKRFPGNIEKFYHYSREKDLALVDSLNDPQIDRSKGIGEQGALKVVEKNSKGVIVRGAKTVCTGVAQGNVSICFRKPIPPDADDLAIHFSVPLNAEGLTIICRPPYARREAAPYQTLTPRFDEIDGSLIFDDTLIPWENVFMYGSAKIISQTFGQLAAWQGYSNHLRVLVRAELLLGVVSLIVDYIGTSKFPNVSHDLSEVIEYVETLRMFIKAAEAQYSITPSGMALPNDAILDMARLYTIENYPRVIGKIHGLSGQSLLMTMTEDDFDRNEIRPYLEKYFAGSNVSAQNKARLFRLAWELSCDAFAGRQILFELFNAASEHAMRDRLARGYDRAPFIELAKKVAGISE